MKLIAFMSRNTKEILRDKINIFFGILFPLLLMGLLTLIQSNIPVEQFPIHKLTSGISVFGLSFISLFSGFLIAKDRSSSFMTRLKCSPLQSSDFIFGYAIPFLPMAFLQSCTCYGAALCLGLDWSINIVLCILFNTFCALLFIGLGLICGTLFTDKQVGSLCGALLTNLVAWLSNTWFDVHLVGGWFEKIANSLPFIHAVNLGRNLYAGNFEVITNDFLWVFFYAILIIVVSILIFSKKELTS